MRQVLIIAAVFFFSLDSSGQISDVKVSQVKNSGTIIVSERGAGIKVFNNTKSDYNLQLISLTDLKLKYTDLKKCFAVFMIDNEIINDNSDIVLVDENNILSISVERVENRKERHKFNFLKIETRTEENIRKSKEIRIRGSEEI